MMSFQSLAAGREIFRNVLRARYEETECNVLFSIAAEHVTGWDNTRQRLEWVQSLPPESVKELQTILTELKQGRPVQYILGTAPFMGLQLKVSEAVLIPRPETEELVQLILNQNERQTGALRVWDIGTGSGCIALALKHFLSGSQVHATDVSSSALSVARANASAMDCDVAFIQHDILLDSCNPFEEPFDIIVSNPPYVRETEKKSMESHVVDHEPHQALFVPDSDALVFYRAIVNCAQQTLKVGGQIWFEINAALHQEVLELINCSTFDRPLVHNDLQGKPRFVSATLLQ